MQNPIEQPLFLVGAERSGSTMLSLMLRNHPMIGWLGQFEFTTSYIPNEFRWPEISEYHDKLLIDRIFLAAKLKIDKSLDYPGLMRSFLAQKQKEIGKPIIGAAVHLDFQHLPRIWPNAKFLYLIRDGRDVTRSCIQMGWAGNMWTASQRWLDAETEREQLYTRINPSQYTEIRYEDLVTEPHLELSRVCDFIGIKFDSSMMSYHEHSTYSKPDQKLTRQWEKKLSKQDIQLCEARISAQLKDRGYSLSGFEEKKISRLHRLYLRIQDKVYRTRFRINRYGLDLVLRGAIARRLKLTNSYNAVKFRIMEIDTQHLK